MAKIKTEVLNISDIKAYANNPRRNEKAINAVMESIKKFGYANPIIVNADNVVLAGHTRLEAIRKTGAMQVQVIRLTHLTEQQEKAFRIADNRTAEFAEWDGDLLEAEMKDIEADDWAKFGFSQKMLEKLAAPNMCKCPKCGQQFVKV